MTEGGGYIEKGGEKMNWQSHWGAAIPYFPNYTLQRTGTLWKGPILNLVSSVLKEILFLFCQRYIELNPYYSNMVGSIQS